MFLFHLVPWLSVNIHRKFYGDRPSCLVNLSVGGQDRGEGVKRKRGIAKCSDFGPVEGYFSETVQNYCRLLPNLATLNDLEWRNNLTTSLHFRTRSSLYFLHRAIGLCFVFFLKRYHVLRRKASTCGGIYARVYCIL